MAIAWSLSIGRPASFTDVMQPCGFARGRTTRATVGGGGSGRRSSTTVSGSGGGGRLRTSGMNSFAQSACAARFQVPISFQALPSLNSTLAESRKLAGVAAGASSASEAAERR